MSNMGFQRWRRCRWKGMRPSRGRCPSPASSCGFLHQRLLAVLVDLGDQHHRAVFHFAVHEEPCAAVGYPGLVPAAAARVIAGRSSGLSCRRTAGSPLEGAAADDGRDSEARGLLRIVHVVGVPVSDPKIELVVFGRGAAGAEVAACMVVGWRLVRGGPGADGDSCDGEKACGGQKGPCDSTFRKFS